MPPTWSTVTAVPASTSISSSKPPTHQPSIPAMIVLALFLSLMAALAIGVILRQRKAMASLRTHEASPQEKHPGRSRSQFSLSLSCFRRKARPRRTAADTVTMDDPTAVGALHATSVLLAAAPCHVFSPPMTMHFRIPLQDKTVLILGVPLYPVRCAGAQQCGVPAVRIPNSFGTADLSCATSA
ncbi:hypothetical protein JVT61DRAFT_3352 [Boletus reticuloceps]|uniref:Uncharacterized protein n=1 Tax=Boletus reticuloceps TaxID=495285 RepID=A0A8I2YN63_9AGAM|nr:hypothetical protein JVT61DRAFT_3352 [Boletus reticuloceps]